MKAQRYMFKNLNCPNCAAKPEKAVSALPGVQEAKVSFGTGALTVKYDETVANEESIHDTFRKFNLDVASVLPGRV